MRVECGVVECVRCRGSVCVCVCACVMCYHNINNKQTDLCARLPKHTTQAAAHPSHHLLLALCTRPLGEYYTIRERHGVCVCLCVDAHLLTVDT